MKKIISILSLLLSCLTLMAFPKIESFEVQKSGNVKMIIKSDVPFKIERTVDFKKWEIVSINDKNYKNVIFIDTQRTKKFPYSFYRISY